jgi:hypothetical protein
MYLCRCGKKGESRPLINQGRVSCDHAGVDATNMPPVANASVANTSRHAA